MSALVTGSARLTGLRAASRGGEHGAWRRLLAVLARALDEERAEDEVHFHQGPSGQPACCYDRRCTSPRLEMEDETEPPREPERQTVAPEGRDGVTILAVHVS